MPKQFQDEIRANTPVPQGQVEIAAQETARVTATGEWICDGESHGPGGKGPDHPAGSDQHPVAGAAENCLVVIETTAGGERKHAFKRDDDSLEFRGPCTLTFTCNGPAELLDENFGLIAVSVEIS